MIYISAAPWIFNIILVGTIILLAGEIIVARKDERGAHSRMLEFFEEGEHSSPVTIKKGEDDMVDGKNMIALTTCIKRWVKNREIDKAHPQAQFVKVVEEVGEIAEGLAKKDTQMLMDGIGDTYVTLVALCATLGLEIDECVYQAYKEIENRKGGMVDGVFIKEEDL